MKDQLDDFVEKNRDAFDDKQPSERVWKGVESEMKFQKPSLWNSVGLWRAAAILFMAASAYLLYTKMNVPDRQEMASNKTHQQVVNEFADVEEFYFQEISEKTALIEQFKRADGLNGFTNDFKQLEAMYNVLKEEMQTSPSQKVKDALVLNLLVRIDLLNQELHKLEVQKEQPKEGTKASKNV
jgi:hypothetical protein